MGESDKPVMRYSTSEMAKDALELLDHVGWVGQRSAHVIGISMGGMIAQEMVYLHGWRIANGVDVNLGLSRPRKNNQSFTGVDRSPAQEYHGKFCKPPS